MQVILLERVHNLGNLGDQVVVKPGYGRNFLIPKNKAVSATEANIAKFEARRQELEAKADAEKAAAETRATGLTELAVTIAARAGDEGKLFGSIGTRDLADAISQAGAAVAKSEIRLPNGAIREIGEYMIEVQLHTDVVTAVKVLVVAE